MLGVKLKNTLECSGIGTLQGRWWRPGSRRCRLTLCHPGRFQDQKSQATSARVPGHRPQTRCRAGPLPRASTCPVLLTCSRCFPEGALRRGRLPHMRAKCCVLQPLRHTAHSCSEKRHLSETCITGLDLGEPSLRVQHRERVCKVPLGRRAQRCRQVPSNGQGTLTDLPSPPPEGGAGAAGTGPTARGRTPGPHSSPPPTLLPLPGKSSLAFLPRTLLPGPPEGCPGCTGSAHTLDCTSWLRVPHLPRASHQPRLCYPILSGELHDKKGLCVPGPSWTSGGLIPTGSSRGQRRACSLLLETQCFPGPRGAAGGHRGAHALPRRKQPPGSVWAAAGCPGTGQPQPGIRQASGNGVWGGARDKSLASRGLYMSEQSSLPYFTMRLQNHLAGPSSVTTKLISSSNF